MNPKLHAVTDAAGRPLRIFLTAGQRAATTLARERFWMRCRLQNIFWQIEAMMPIGIAKPLKTR
ncbi:hypothetical protein IMCC21224_12331 [Puniceibacterium sp. IMCC21224]|nr:hypothetical protein IMCC21224_12331 [Puniceibacterium sp. IMCC21224]